MKNQSSCIRLCPDVAQINRCIGDLNEHAEALRRLSKVLNLAGNEVRLKMLFLLHKEAELCVCDLSDILGMSISAVSQHLRKLKDGGLIRDRRENQTIFYSLKNEKLEVLMPLFGQIEPARV